MALNLVLGLRMWQRKLCNFGHAWGALSILAIWQEEGSESCRQEWEQMGYVKATKGGKGDIQNKQY